MGEYEDTLKDIRMAIGIVPDFMKALPEEVLTKDWALFKKYVLGETQIPGKYREMIGLAVAANIKCSYCELMHTGLAQFHGANEEELREIYFWQV